MANIRKNAYIKVNDDGNIVTLNPYTKIENVEGLQVALDSKGTYSKPSGGIPKTDLSSAVQMSLGKADTALQSETYKGTVTSVKVGSTSYNPSSGVVSLPAYPTTLPASDVSSWAKASSKPTYTASEVGAIATTAKGANNGVAELDANGKVPSSQLPSYVDDVLEYTSSSDFPATGETGKIYVDTTTNLTYRWSGSAYTEISPSLALGTTSSTAYRGDRGKTAYTHAIYSIRLTTDTTSGLYKVASTAQGHIASLTAVTKSDITGLGIPAQDTTYSTATTSANGLMSSTDKTKLDGVATGANNYTHPTTSGNKHIPSGGSSGQILRWSADGTAAWGADNNTWTAMVGATSSANGSVGYVNAVPPKDGYNTKYLRADGTWQVPPNTTYSAATQSTNGLMSSTDKTKLDGIATGATANIGTVTSVKVGSTSYSPSSGVVSLPAYPTTLPANGGTAANVSGIVAIANGGTGATSASAARSNLGLGTAATKSSTTSVTSGSSSLVTSGAVYDAIQPLKATASGNLTRNNLDNLVDGDLTGWFADTLGSIINHWVTIKTRSYVNGSDIHKIQTITSANGYMYTRKYSPDTGWSPWSGFDHVDASIDLSKLSFTKTYSGNGWFYSGTISYATYFRNINSVMIYDFNYIQCIRHVQVAVDQSTGTGVYLVVGDANNPSSLSFPSGSTLDIRLFGMRLV